MKLLNSFWLKIIALITMIIDHSAIIFLSPYSTAYLVCRIIGRISLVWVRMSDCACRAKSHISATVFPYV